MHPLSGLGRASPHYPPPPPPSAILPTPPPGFIPGPAPFAHPPFHVIPTVAAPPSAYAAPPSVVAAPMMPIRVPAQYAFPPTVDVQAGPMYMASSAPSVSSHTVGATSDEGGVSPSEKAAGAKSPASVQQQNSSTSAAALQSRRVHLRKAGGKVWSDSTLSDWPEEDLRLFCGDLGNEVTDDLLANAFRHYKSFQKSRVIRDRRTGKGKGYGFVSFSDPQDMLRALKEMNKKYVGNRPIRVMKSKWQEREIDSDRNRQMAKLTGSTPVGSKTLKKFKVLKPVTGGKKSKAIPPALAASGTRRGFHGARPAPFGQVTRTITRRDG